MPALERIKRPIDSWRTVCQRNRAQNSVDVRIAPVVPRGCAQRVSATLPQAVARIAQELQPEAIILFGSYAYGEPTPDSDVDLLVIWQTDAPGTERSWSVSRLLIPRLFPVDILVRTPDEIEDALAQGDFFIREIITRGKVLYERRQ
ncbi:MAG: nucleotidyltransferase domain-containing protein [Caldilineaceae bacterium]|nr:nucleotidyltransferase domain-containing protein [Caldilineaceae bacterium]